MNKPILSFENVSITIEKKQVLQPFSFTLLENEKVAIVGPSGSGKSLLLQSIIGLSSCSRVNGQMVYYPPNTNTSYNLLSMSANELCSIRGQHLGLILQNPFSQFNPTRKLGVQILEMVPGGNSPENQEKACALFHDLNIENPQQLLQCFAHQLSGGMLQRAVIVMFLLLEPKILLSDEPTTALDPINIHDLLQVLDKIPMAHIFVTHNQKAAEQFCDRILFIKEGRLFCEK